MVQEYNSIHIEKNFDSSFYVNPISASLKGLNAHFQVRVEVKDKWEVSFQRQETSFQANIDSIGCILKEETKQTKPLNIRKKRGTVSRELRKCAQNMKVILIPVPFTTVEKSEIPQK